MEVFKNTYINLLPLMIKHAEIVGLEYDITKLRAVVDSFIFNNSDHSKVCLVLTELGDLPVGYIFAILTPGFLTNDIIANELGFYCERPGQGPLLIKAYEDWAKAQGATKITLTSHNTDRLDNYYSRKGYNLVERTFVKELS